MTVKSQRSKVMTIEITRGTGNVFTDLGFAPSEAANLQVRSDLMIALRERLTALDSTPNEWAELLGVSQSRVNDLLRAKIDRFDADTLIAYLGKTGAEVRVTVHTKGRAARR
jgi:predicted XRE-type DNA-binding protein